MVGVGFTQVAKTPINGESKNPKQFCRRQCLAKLGGSLTIPTTEAYLALPKLSTKSNRSIYPGS